MGFLDRLLGRVPPQQMSSPEAQPPLRTRPAERDSGASEDERAIARYRYLLRTAPPEKLEQAHTEAFARLTPDQREQVLGQLSQTLPPDERLSSTEPQAMARAATRAELRQPGYLEKTFGGPQRGG